MLAPAEEVKDEDEDHQNGESSPDGNGNHVVGNLEMEKDKEAITNV